MGAKCCAVCTKQKKSISRDFSSTAWSVLVAWDEVSFTDHESPMCEECYWDLREVLIDRSKEIDGLVGKVFPQSGPAESKVAV